MRRWLATVFVFLFIAMLPTAMAQQEGIREIPSGSSYELHFGEEVLPEDLPERWPLIRDIIDSCGNEVAFGDDCEPGGQPIPPMGLELLFMGVANMLLP